MKLAACILGYALAMAGANLLFKWSADSTGKWFWIYFLAGNAVGFFCTIFLPLALRMGKPSLVYAMAIGGGFVLLQLASLIIFHQSLSHWQWSGITLVALGIVLLQLG